jgi:GNAT superfamily N-acetyltransferase
MLDGLRYRAATPRDATIIAELVATGFATYRDFAPEGWQPRSPIKEEGHVHDRLSRGDAHARLALDDPDLVGVTGWMPALTPGAVREPIPGRAHVWSLFIAPRYWGTGLAAHLLDWAVSTMRDSGFAAAQLWTPRDSARARAFYDREGWATNGTEFFNDELGLDLVMYEREL